MQRAGCCPTLDDGLAAGNGALLVDGSLLVSRSGRRPGECGPADIVCLQDFDPAGWVGTYASDDDAHRPTSDAPLYWASLVEAPTRFGWARRPTAALHGHVLQTEAAARTLKLPLSHDATVFSTPPDRRALLELMSRAPFPQHDAWIRRGHGFFAVGDDLDAARSRVRALARLAHEAGLLPV